MLNNQIYQQFMALQGRSCEFSEGLRNICSDEAKDLAELNCNAVKVLGAIAQEYADRFSTVHDPATLPTLFGSLESHEVMRYWLEYQSKVTRALCKGGRGMYDVLGGMSEHARSDFENIAHGFMSAGPLSGVPMTSVLRTYFDTFMNGCDLMANSTINHVKALDGLVGENT